MHNTLPKIKKILANFILTIFLFATAVTAYAINDADWSALSYDVYQDIDRPPLPAGWDILARFPSNLQNTDVYAIAYRHLIYKTDTNQSYEVVIALRGTKLDFYSSWADVQIMLGITPDAFTSTITPFVNNIRNFIQNKSLHLNADYTLAGITGHSLGALLTELVGATYVHDPVFGRIKVVTYESPGTKDDINKLIAEGKAPADAISALGSILNSNFADVNLINTYNEQAHTNPQQTIPFMGYKFAHEQFTKLLYPDSPGLFLYYFSPYTINQHQIKNFYICAHDPSIKCDYNVVYPCPIGVTASYKDYRNYYGHNDYWNAYMDYQWNNDANVRDTFNNIRGSYEKYFIEALKNNNNEANITTGNTASNEHQYADTKLSKIIKNAATHSTELQQIYDAATNNKKLFYAILAGDSQLAKQLLTNTDANANYQYGNNHVPLLQVAIKMGHLDIVQLLLQSHANPNLEDDNGNTALHTVAYERYDDAANYAKILINFGAKPNVKNRLGYTPQNIMEKHCPECAKTFAAELKNNI